MKSHHNIKEGNIKLTLSINKLLLRGYKEYCNKEGLIISKQFENFIKKELKKWDVTFP